MHYLGRGDKYLTSLKYKYVEFPVSQHGSLYAHGKSIICASSPCLFDPVLYVLSNDVFDIFVGLYSSIYVVYELAKE